MLAAAVGPEHDDAQVRQPSRHRRWHRRPAQAKAFDAGLMGRCAVRVIEQAGDEVGRPAAEGQAVAFHQSQYDARVPVVDQVHRPAVEHRDEQSGEHSDEVPDRCRGQLVVADRPDLARELTRLADQAAMAVHDALGRAGGAGGERDQRGTRGVGGDRAGHRFIGEEVVEVAPDHADDLDVGAQIGLIGQPAELLGGDEYPRLGGGEDVRQFFAAIEMHDRHQRRTQERRGPERRRCFHPIGQLKSHHITGADAAGPQPGCEPTGYQLRRRRMCQTTAGRPSTPGMSHPARPAAREPAPAQESRGSTSPLPHIG